MLRLGSVPVEVDAGVDARDVPEAQSLKLGFREIRVHDDPVSEEKSSQLVRRVEILAQRRDGLEGLAFRRKRECLDDTCVLLRRREEVVSHVETPACLAQVSEELEFCLESEVSAGENRFLMDASGQSFKPFFRREERQLVASYFFAELVRDFLGSLVTLGYERACVEDGLRFVAVQSEGILHEDALVVDDLVAEIRVAAVVFHHEANVPRVFRCDKRYGPAFGALARIETALVLGEEEERAYGKEDEEDCDKGFL